MLKSFLTQLEIPHFEDEALIGVLGAKVQAREQDYQNKGSRGQGGRVCKNLRFRKKTARGRRECSCLDFIKMLISKSSLCFATTFGTTFESVSPICACNTMNPCK